MSVVQSIFLVQMKKYSNSENLKAWRPLRSSSGLPRGFSATEAMAGMSVGPDSRIRANQLLGARGEMRVASHLQALGYTLFGLRVRNRFGEIDLVVYTDAVVGFVEVKSSRIGIALQRIGSLKLRAWRRAAAQFLIEEPRFNRRVIHFWVASVGQTGQVSVLMNTPDPLDMAMMQRDALW